MRNTGIFLMFILIGLVLFSSGCSDFGYLDSISGINSKEMSTTNVADVITIEKVASYPESPVFAGRDFKLYVTIKNNDRKNVVSYVLAEVYDPSFFEISESSKSVGSLLPLGTAVVSFDMRAPTADKIANVETEGLIGIRVKYLYETETTYDLVAVSEDMITEAQQSGKDIQVLSTKVMGSGPLRIYPEILGTDKSVLIGTSPGNVAFTLKNEGSGFVEGGAIPQNWFKVDFPSELNVNSDYAGTGRTTTTQIHTTTTNNENPISSTTLPEGCTGYGGRGDGCPCSSSSECQNGYCWGTTSSYVCHSTKADCYTQSGDDSYTYAPSADQCYNDCKYEGGRCVPELLGNGQTCTSASQCSSGRCWSQYSGSYVCQSQCASCPGTSYSYAPSSASCCPDCSYQNGKCISSTYSSSKQENEVCSASTECASGKCWGVSDSLFRCHSASATTSNYAPDSAGCSPYSRNPSTNKCYSTAGSPTGNAIASIISGQAVAVGLPVDIFSWLQFGQAPTGMATFTCGSSDSYDMSCQRRCERYTQCFDSRGSTVAQQDYPNPCSQVYIPSGSACAQLSVQGGDCSDDDIYAGEICYCTYSTTCAKSKCVDCARSDLLYGTCDIYDYDGHLCGWGGSTSPTTTIRYTTTTGYYTTTTGYYTTTTHKTTTTKTTTTRTTTTSTTIPLSVTPAEETTKNVFTSSGNVYYNTLLGIRIIGKESVPFVFYVAAPYVENYRTFTVHASVKYVYEIRNTFKILVKPMVVA